MKEEEEFRRRSKCWGKLIASGGISLLINEFFSSFFILVSHFDAVSRMMVEKCFAIKIIEVWQWN